MANFTNTQRDAAINAIKAAASADRADNKLALAASDLVESGIAVDDIKAGGKHLKEFQDIAAQSTLTEKQYATWADDSLAQGKTVNGKRVDTPRGKLVKQVNSFIARVRAKMATPAKKGAQGPARRLDQIIAEQCDAWIKRISKDKDSENFKFGDANPIAVRAALKDVIAAFKGK